MFLLVPAQGIVAQFMKTFEEFPPRAKAASFTVSHVMDGIVEKQKKMAAMQN
jgi:hypothetical protein